MLPPLHLVTHDEVLARPDFCARAAAFMDTFGPAVALHLRARHVPALRLHELAAELASTALRSGSTLVINDRVDIALAVRAAAHLGAASLPVRDARRLLHHGLLGYSAHELTAAALAVAEGADYVFLGTIYATASHPGRAPAGPQLIAAVAPRLSVPVIAIGGITPERVAEVRAWGAAGVAVIGGIWEAPDTLTAARAYLAELGSVAAQAGEQW